MKTEFQKNLNSSQRSNLTGLSRDGNLNMKNRKPYRTKSQKKMAKDTAVLCKDGTWRSDAPVTYHHR